MFLKSVLILIDNYSMKYGCCISRDFTIDFGRMIIF